MSSQVFDSAAILIVLAALFGYLNHRFLRLPFAIGMTVSALVAALGVMGLDVLFPALRLGESARAALASLDFPELLMHGMLSFLLFAGSLHVDLGELLEKLKTILTLATAGVVVSAAIVGLGSHYVFAWMGLAVPLSYCLVFGALISPTDPVAVLGIMKAAGAPKSLEVKIVGESLLNDGVGVVLFTVLLAIATGAGAHAAEASEPAAIAAVLGREILGGIALGLACGYAAYRALRTLDEPNLEILISVALVMGLSFLAFRLHSSAPLACVVAGFFIGNRGRLLAMSDRTRQALDLIWGFIDEVLNAVLFLLVGLEVLAIRFEKVTVAGAVLMIPLALAARLLSVSLAVKLLSRVERLTPGAVKVLTWGGLKGGISVALALSLTAFEGRATVLAATYAVVLFSIIVQGLSVGRLVRSVQ